MAQSMNGADDNVRKLTDDQKPTVELIFRRFEEFSAEQLKRFNGLVQHCEEVLQQDTAARQELESERHRLQCERSEQIKQLQQESEMLQEAWTRLENEQRQLLAERATLQVAASSGNLDSASRESDSVATVCVPAMFADQTEREHGSPTRQAAVRQFQQLSREIGRRSRQRT